MKNIIILIMAALLIGLGYQYYFIDESSGAHNHGEAPLSEIENIKQTKENSKRAPLHANFKRKSLGNDIATAHDSLHQHLDKQKEHHHISDNIKQALCEDELIHQACVIKQNLDIQKVIIDELSHNVKADEISVILASNNFQNVMETLSASKVEQASFEREYKLNDRIDNFISNNQTIVVDRLACGDIACATSIYYQEVSDWEAFSKSFLKEDDGTASIGNLFIAHLDRLEGQETRILFLPNNNSAVVKRIKK
ncbi:hypothetical protein L2755_10155 [Shewanella abyssi]|uniref:hypothetical protein n=1 Tax=Shewanella abyssi TaxID=311789 RepID=UPI00200D2CDB|nr:hypothetical protein [Shewanella abyssi]MCL1049983.1 hypothetical protein [Shewanella abyssi]